jgi:NADPH:quinone reductase-like Zn-dependent oxidoreductase
MKQIWIQRSGGPEVLTLRDAPDPTPGPGDVLIDVAAAGVNFADVLARMGMYPDAPPLPAVVGYEVAGTVRDVGAGVTGITAGREVVALTRFGGYSDVVSVPEAQVFLKPAGMSFSEAAAVPVNYLTAALALFRFGSLQAGETVLVQNAGGGVGIAATQLAKSRGATVYGTASAWKHEELSRLGVDHSIDYRHEDVISAVNDLTGGRGVDIILDPIGGSSLKRDMEILAPMGRLIAFGLSESVRNGRRSKLSLLAAALRMPRPSFISLLGKNHSVAGLNIGHLWGELSRLRGVMDEITAAYRDGAVKPIVCAEVPFAEAGDAHRMLQERRNLGKVVLVP